MKYHKSRKINIQLSATQQQQKSKPQTTIGVKGKKNNP